MIEVRIRHEAEDRGYHFASIPVEQLSTVFSALQDWGIVGLELEQVDDLYGQFVIGADAVHFEVVIPASIPKERAAVARRIYNDHVREHGTPPGVAELMRHLKDAGHPTGNRSAAAFLAEFRDGSPQ